MAHVSSGEDRPEAEGGGRPAGHEAPAREPGEGRALLKLAVLVMIVAGAVVAVRVTPLGDLLSRDGIDGAVRWLRGSTWAPVTFIAVYTGSTALALPGSILTLAGGALFGLFWGVIYNSIAANLGANLAFLLARWLGRDGVERLLGDRLEKLDRATRDHGFRGLLTLRLVPLVPFNALNFGAGLTAMRWSTYALATAIGILPGTIVYTMFADALLEGSTQASREALVRVAVSGALLVLLSFLPQIVKKMNISLPGTARLPGWWVLPALLLPAGLGAATPERPQATEASAGDLPAILQALPDHDRFTDLLGDVVSGSRVDYARLAREPERLEAYLDELADTDLALLERAPRPVRLAFWINAYNACMLTLVAEHYPIEPDRSLLSRLRNRVADRPANSVWQIPDVFTRDHCTVAGRPRSQDEIEHEIIRPMGEPRIHFAVNCAALSCPRLRGEAYEAERLNGQLEAAVHDFIASRRHLRVDRDQGTLRLNRVLDWYGEDFGGEAGLREFLAGYLDADARAFVLDPDTGIAYLDYDWTLNDVER